ncbi:MAG: hypothetical protein GXP49_02800 [Deltaproteobacteria bacterium]|nr:hypothetical protein [Deltaproteobacteria bacterium]
MYRFVGSTFKKEAGITCNVPRFSMYILLIIIAVTAGCKNNICKVDQDCSGNLVCIRGSCSDPDKLFRDRESMVEYDGELEGQSEDAGSLENPEMDASSDRDLDLVGDQVDTDLSKERKAVEGEIELEEVEEVPSRVVSIDIDIDGKDVPVSKPLQAKISLQGSGMLGGLPIDAEVFFRGRVMVTASADGALFLVNIGTGKKQVIKQQSQIGRAQLFSDGTIYIGETSTSKIIRMAPDGNGGYLESIYIDLGSKLGSTGRLSRFAWDEEKQMLFALYVDASQARTTLARIEQHEIYSVKELDCRAFGLDISADNIIAVCSSGRVIQMTEDLKNVHDLLTLPISGAKPRLEGVTAVGAHVWFADFPVSGTPTGRVFRVENGKAALWAQLESGVHEIAEDDDGSLLVTTQGVSMGKGRIERISPKGQISTVVFEGLALDAANGYDGAIIIEKVQAGSYNLISDSAGEVLLNDPDVFQTNGRGPYTLEARVHDPFSGEAVTGRAFFNATD